MCILVTKKKGVAFPSVQTVKNCMDSNPDGFAMAFNYKGEVITYKSMDYDDFLETYKSLVKNSDKNDTAVMLHMRIATHGSVGLSNCHCWKGNILGSEMAFAHNGILHHIGNRDNMTDSETFLRDYIEPCDNMADFLEVIDKNIGSSKFAFLDGEGHVIRFGSFIEERGVHYSNGSFRRYAWATREADPRLWGRFSKAI